MELGNQLLRMVTYTSEATPTTKRADTDDMFGLTAASTKETLLKTSSNYFFYFRHGKGRLIYTDGK